MGTRTGLNTQVIRLKWVEMVPLNVSCIFVRMWLDGFGISGSPARHVVSGGNLEHLCCEPAHCGRWGMTVGHADKEWTSAKIP